MKARLNLAVMWMTKVTQKCIILWKTMVREKTYFCVCDVDDVGHTKMYNNMEDYDQGKTYFRDQ